LGSSSALMSLRATPRVAPLPPISQESAPVPSISQESVKTVDHPGQSNEELDEKVNEGVVEGSALVEALVTPYLESKGVFILFWAQPSWYKDPYSALSGGLCFTVTIAVMCAIPMLLGYQEWPPGTDICLREASAENKCAAFFLFLYLHVSMATQFTLPRAYSYIRDVKGATSGTLSFCNWELHLGVVTRIICTGLVFVGTFILFVENSGIADLLLNCVALTFCAEASATVTTCLLTEPTARQMQKASNALDEEVSGFPGSDLHKEWSTALENESFWKAYLHWPVHVSTAQTSDYIYCAMVNVCRLIGIFLNLCIPFCL